MNHNNKNTRFLKPFSLAFMSCIFALTLSSCSASDDRYSSIDGNKNYLTLDKYSVTNQELYDQMKWSASDYLSSVLNSTIIKDEIATVKEAVEGKISDSKVIDQYRNEVQMALICDVYGISEYSEYVGLNNPYVMKNKEKEFIVKQSTNNKVGNITKTDLDVLMSRKTVNKDLDENEKYDEENGIYAFEYSALSKTQKNLLAQYYETVAQKIYAYKVLEKEIADHNEDLEDDEDRYFSNSEIISYWKDNYHYKTDLNAIVIRFINEDEVKAVLKSFGLKTYRSKLYYIAQAENETDAEYSKFYDDYDFTKPPTLRTYQEVGPQLAFSLYLEMYNYIYTTRQNLPTNSTVISETSNCRAITDNLWNYYTQNQADGAIRGNYYALDYIKELESTNPDLYNAITYNKESLDEINSSLSSYVYDTLKDVTYDYIDEEKQTIKDTTKNNYSTAGQSYGDFYYMVYKIKSIDVAEKLYYTNNQENEIFYVEEDNKVYKYKGSSKVEITDDQLKEIDENHPLLNENNRKAYYELLCEIYQGLKDDTVSSTYISTCMTNAKSNVKARIYDKDIEIAYLSANADYTRNRKSGEDSLVATFEYEDEELERSTSASVNMIDVWNNLEPTTGISSAISLLSTQIVKSTAVYEEIVNDKEKTDIYYQNLNNLLSNFAADQLSSSGYSASLGKYNFLKLYFHTSNMKEIIENYYCVNAASTSLINDYANDTLAEELTKFANNYYESYFSVEGKNLLVYVDMDEDGEADRTETGLSYVDSEFDWNTEDKNSHQTYRELAIELIKKIIKLCDNSTSSNETTITDIITEYNKSSRFTNGHDKDNSDGEYDPTEPETQWAKYRRAGIFLKLEDLSVSNTSDYASVNDVLKLAVYKAYKDEFLFNGKDGVMPSEYLLRSYYENNAEGLYSSFGYNLPILTSATTKASAKYEQEENNGELYTNLVYIYNEDAHVVTDIFNDEDTISVNQAKAFILEYASSGSSTSLPSSVTSALTTYLQPAFTRYTSEATQFEVLVTWMKKQAGLNVSASDNISNGLEFGNDSSNYNYYDNDMNAKEEFQCYNNLNTFEALLVSNHESADSFLSVENVYSSDTSLTFFSGDNSSANVAEYFSLLNQYDGWWTTMKEYIINNVKLSTKEGK